VPVIAGSAGPNDRLCTRGNTLSLAARTADSSSICAALFCVTDNIQNNDLPNYRSSIMESTKIIASQVFKK